MKKVVVIHNRLVIGGPAVAIAETIKKLNHQFEFFLIVGSPLADEMDASYLFNDIPNLNIITISSMKRMPNVLADFNAYGKLKKILRQIQPDVVHTHGTKPGLIGRMAAKAVGIKTIIHTYHGHIFHSYFNKLISSVIVRVEKYLATKTSFICVISKHLENEIINKYKIAGQNKVVYIPLGLDLSEFQLNYEGKREQFRNKYGVADHQIAIGVIGRLTAIKNIEMFVDIIINMKSTELFNKFKFFITGDGSEKEKLIHKLQQHQVSVNVNNNNTEANVFFTSWVTNPSLVTCGLDILCLTSLNEGTPVCIIEAMASKVPVVSTNVGSVAEMIKQNETGYLISVNDIQKATEHICYLANNDKERMNMGLNALVSIENKYKDPQIWEKMRQLYSTEIK